MREQGGHGGLLTGHMQQVLHGRIPERHPYSPAPVAVFASLNDFVGSFRHALFDFIVPVFNLLQLFRMYTPDVLLLEAQHQVWWCVCVWESAACSVSSSARRHYCWPHQGHDPDAARFLMQPEDNARSLTRLISQNRLAGLRDIVRAAPPRSEATCFHTLLAGSGHLQVCLPRLRPALARGVSSLLGVSSGVHALQASEARVRTSTFYAAALANLGVEPPAGPGKRPVVTVVTKKGRRAIENAAEVAEALRTRFMGVDVNLLDGNSLSTVSVKARVCGRAVACTHACAAAAPPCAAGHARMCRRRRWCTRRCW